MAAAVVVKDGIDIGIVVRDAEAMVRFYRDLVGFPYEEEIVFPNGMVMHRLRCGDTVVKLVAPPQVPPLANPPGGAVGGTGLRYWTASIANIDEVIADLRAAGVPIVREIGEARPGVRIAIVADPEGNWLEFIDAARAEATPC